MKVAGRTIRIAVIASVAALSVVATANAAGWGTIKGRFVVDGSAPTPAPLNASSDAFCVNHKPMDETVVVGEGGALANVVVYLRADGDKIEIHPDFAATATQPVALDNKDCAFHPHVTLVRVGQSLVIKNSDPVGHNTKTSLKKNANFNQIIPASSEIPFTLTKAEALPTPVNCSIHPFMQGFLLVLDHPYMAVSEADGTFEISNIPAGNQELQFWHEAPGYLKNLKFKGGSTSRQGRAKIKVADGETLDLGDIKIPATALK